MPCSRNIVAIPGAPQEQHRRRQTLLKIAQVQLSLRNRTLSRDAPGSTFHLAIFRLSDSPYFSNQVFFNPSGVCHASLSFRSHSRMTCLLWDGLSTNALRACWHARLLISCMSPFCSLTDTQCSTAVKCTMSSASAWTSVMGGTPGPRGDVREPVIGRREKQKPGPWPSKLKSRGRVFQYAGVRCLNQFSTSLWCGKSKHYL
jgi:hypothetical protein